MMGTESFTPLISTAWLFTGMPALTRFRQARAVSGVISSGWLKCVWIQILPADGQQIDQFRVEQPLRQRHRHSRADADHVDMVDRGQFGDEPAQLGDRQRQRIAAGDDHVADRFAYCGHIRSSAVRCGWGRPSRRGPW